MKNNRDNIIQLKEAFRENIKFLYLILNNFRNPWKRHKELFFSNKFNRFVFRRKMASQTTVYINFNQDLPIPNN